MTTIVLVLALAASGAPDPCARLLERLERTDPRAPAEILKLGKECEEAGCVRLATLAYGRVLRLGDDVTSASIQCEASFRLAHIELQRKEYESAFVRLREVVIKCPDHNEAQALLANAESDKTREQVLNVRDGDAQFELGDYSRALEHFERAYDLLPDQPSEAPYVPRADVLTRLADCRDRIDDLRYEKEFLPRNRSVVRCPECAKSKTKGFVDCPTCKGTGKVESWKVTGITGRGNEKVLESCPQCLGHGYRACGNCYALGYWSEKITAKETKALETLAQNVMQPRVYLQPLDKALQTVEAALLTEKEGATLNYLRAMKPDYALSQDLRKALGSVPPQAANLARTKAQWEKVAENHRLRVSFLLDYACEFSDSLRHFEMLRQSRRPVTRDLPEAIVREEALTPEILSAFPEDSKLAWLTIQGTFLSYEETPEELKGYLTIEGEARHSVKFFAWLPMAQERLRALSVGPWKRPTEEIVERYPFALGSRLAKAPKEHRILLVGRFLRDPFSFPRNWFEVWDFRIGLSRPQEIAFQALRTPIHLSLPNHSLGQVAQLFEDWLDLKIQLDGVPDDALVRCEAAECPRGLVIDALARAVEGADWYYDGTKVVFCKRGDNPHESDMRVVVSRLAEERSAETLLNASPGERAPALAVAPPPSDPAGLRVAAYAAALEMRYDRAAGCYASLVGVAEDPTIRRAAQRAAAKMRLFDVLTERTPVSRLAEASELTEIVYQKPSGDLVQATVVLRRTADGWVVQDAYGSSVQIRPDMVRRMTSLSAEDWRRRKEELLLRREHELMEEGASDRVEKLFLLALFAKTHKLFDRGTAYLQRAAELSEFPSFLRRFFPERHEELASLWREATLREATSPDAASAPEPEPPVETSAKPSPQPKSEVPLEPVAPLEDGLSPGELLIRARLYAQSGSACARRVLEGENAAVWRQHAIDNFTQAELAVARFLERTPDDPGAQRIRQDITAVKNACVKDMGFFE